MPYVVLDGHCGHHHARAMAQQNNLPLIATLRGDAALSFPSAGPSAGRGPQRTYGNRVDDDDLPAPYLKKTTIR